MQPLSEQLEAANRRADSERARADQAELRADTLQAKLEAGRLAEQLARDEAAELRAELDTRRQWGLGRRLRWVLGRW